MQTSKALSCLGTTRLDITKLKQKLSSSQAQERLLEVGLYKTCQAKALPRSHELLKDMTDFYT